MCDNIVALGSATADGSVIFGKNSDREPNEPQAAVFIPRAKHPPGSVVHCTYIDMPQVEETYAVLLSKPSWLWGGEMGASEHGLVIGNTALFTRMDYDTGPGLEVRCLYDASGGAMSKQYLQDLTKAGVEILPYLEYRNLTRLHTANYRSHRKIAVIDSKIGYVGGLNLDKEQMDSPAFDTWRDTHLRIVGEGAWALQASFVISWFNTTGQKVIGQQYYPPVETENFMPVQITQGGPDSQWKAIRQLYFQMITSAEDKLYIQSPFFIPDESILAALKAAALAGVDVQLMFTPRGSTYQIPYRAAHTYFKDVVEAGAKVYLYFFEDLKHCQRWTLEEYNSDSPVHRFVDSVYRLASPLL